MKTSIRTKLFIGISAIVLSFVLMSWGLTILGLEKFYVWQKKASLIGSAKMFDDIYRGDPEEISLELERLGNTLGAVLIIVEENGFVKYSSFGRIISQKRFERLSPPQFSAANGLSDQNGISAPPMLGPPSTILKSREYINNNSILEMQQDRQVKIDFMVLGYRLNNQDFLLIRQPLAPVSESATVAGQFMLFTGLLSLLAGGAWAYVFARKFTTPILELNQIAQHMSQLDFSQKCTIARGDEIGELGNSINNLSDQLDTAISELNKKNRQLMADMEKERKLDKMRKEFVSNVSHELKTPLALILGYAEGLKENIARDEENRNYYCSVIIDEADKMDRLVKDLLNLSQIESGTYDLYRTDFNLSIFLHDIIQKYQTLLQEKEILLETEIEPDLTVNGDVLRIEQVVVNLFNNAIDHAGYAKMIKISAADIGDHIRVYVYNTGNHIPSESLTKIWTSFYKVDQARTRNHGRYGLGLSIVRAIQDMHGNAYGAENVLDGVTFWFDLTKPNL
ncbi:MAG TPA: HAMP domain-containing sensor histidine kinase [Methylomusa anaerophila]|uniref:histidine kinase n=1 Tax=Methylomusa anaerophila TaxID=1930071 RepID=A0A348ALP7_9FIRM|nr:HAMP domain-containing sensor histidine kinase [Methylomusa anaerophila]BBB91995.1 alkaline phosphatase synthesis sensor protein PhoR [Methylomusa anaerophila]HML87992.1 HAMP domain-containing sensor histidine kinase [Methylomusa anaerophila]